MPQLTNAFALSQPRLFTVTFIESQEEADSYNAAHPEYTVEPNHYVVEGVDESGNPDGYREYLSTREFSERYDEQPARGMEYGVRNRLRPNGDIDQLGQDITKARVLASYLNYRRKTTDFEVVTRKYEVFGSDEAWQPVGPGAPL